MDSISHNFQVVKSQWYLLAFWRPELETYELRPNRNIDLSWKWYWRIWHFPEYGKASLYNVTSTTLFLKSTETFCLLNWINIFSGHQTWFNVSVCKKFGFSHLSIKMYFGSLLTERQPERQALYLSVGLEKKYLIAIRSTACFSDVNVNYCDDVFYF